MNFQEFCTATNSDKHAVDGVLSNLLHCTRVIQIVDFDQISFWLLARVPSCGAEVGIVCMAWSEKYPVRTCILCGHRQSEKPKLKPRNPPAPARANECESCGATLPSQSHPRWMGCILFKF